MMQNSKGGEISEQVGWYLLSYMTHVEGGGGGGGGGRGLLRGCNDGKARGQTSTSVHSVNSYSIHCVHFLLYHNIHHYRCLSGFQHC